MNTWLLVVALGVGACSRSDSPPPAPTQAPSPTPPPPTAPMSKTTDADARELVAAGAAVIDVRTADEFADDHLPQATNIPVQELANRMPEVEKLVGGDKTKPIVVHCASGKRSEKAKAALEAAGYSNVVNAGGLDDLREQP